MSGNPQELARNAVWRKAGELLQIVRQRRQFSPAQLAERAGVSADLIVAYEQGRERFPEVEAMWRITTALGIDLVQFLRHAEAQSGATLLGGVTAAAAPLANAPARTRDEINQLDSFVRELQDRPDGPPPRPTERR